MFERLRAQWASLVGPATDFPPPTCGEPKTMASVSTGLQALFDRSLERFDRCFLRGQPLRVMRKERELFERLASLGVVARVASSFYAPCVRLFSLYGRFVATDLLTHRRPDQVFSLMFEQVYLIRNMHVRPTDDVLELCVGSGVNSLFAADTARSVTGVDINPRALAFARFNMALNPPKVPVDLRDGSLFAPVDDDRRFDRILVNPPFEPVPPDTDGYLHSAGGEDGLDVVRDVLRGVADHLAPEGHLMVITWSPGGTDGPLVADLFRQALSSHRLCLHMLEQGPLSAVLERFEGRPGYDTWSSRLAERGLTHLYFVFLDSQPSDEPGLEVLHPRAEVAACHAFF
jgi:protein-L-isoaspartate O-methyltransferase